MSLTIQLSQPITIKGKPFAEITLRDITGPDAIEIGLPYLLLSMAEDGLVAFEFRVSVLVRYISRLAGIPIESVQHLSIRDLGKCHAFIHGFFNDDIKGVKNHG